MTDLVHSGSASIPGGDEAAGTTMLERAAWNLAFNRCLDAGMNHEASKYHADNCWPEQVSNARAVLMAVRTDFSRSVSDAGKHTVKGAADECERSQAESAFASMIDAILADGEGG